MADPSSLTCTQCQAQLPPDATFCLRCGARVVRAWPTPAAAPVAAPVPAPASRNRSGTLLGVAMNTPAAPGPQVAPAPQASAPQAFAAPAPASPSEPAPDAAVVAPRRVANAHATMVGVVAPGPGATPAAPASPRSGTMQGVAPTIGAVAPAQAAPRTGQTMQGVAVTPPPGMPQAAAPQPAISSTGRHRREVMLGSEPQGAAHAWPQTPSPVDTFDGDVPGLPKRRGGSVFGWVFLGLMAVVGAGAGAWWYTHRSQPEAPITAALRTQPGGAQIVSLTVPDAAGARVRYNGAEHALDAQGHAEFAVTLPAGRVGYVDVPIELVRASGAVERRGLRFLVAWRAETDLRRLADDPPKVHINFHVMRGSSLWIAGQPIRVSGETGIAELAGPPPTPAGDGDARRERYPVRVVTPDGTSIEEQYELRIPRTQLRVQTPSPVAMSREASVAVRGTAPTATRVRIGGTAATVAGGAFSAVVPLAVGSNSLDVVAYAPDGAPALVNVTVYRDVPPETYLLSGGGDRGVAALTAQPLVNGARLRVTGTVLGQVLESPSGRTCQLVVESRACPSGRCTTWIDLPEGAQVVSGAQVEVVGEVRGARAYALASGERRSDPVVIAVIVTPRR